MSELATLTFDGPSATLTLNRPEQRNALSTDMLAAAHACLDELAAKASPPTVLVLTGSGKSFCAGMDLKQVIIEDAGGIETPKALLTSLAKLTHRLRLLPSVTVARVTGAAIGGGCGLACVCDLAVTHAMISPRQRTPRSARSAREARSRCERPKNSSTPSTARSTSTCCSAARNSQRRCSRPTMRKPGCEHAANRIRYTNRRPSCTTASSSRPSAWIVSSVPGSC